MEALVAALQGTRRAPGLDLGNLQKLSDYWEATRTQYEPFECGLRAGTADVYRHEIPGGQYSNLRPQAAAVGLADRWTEVKDRYRDVNLMLGELIKVTPSSKAVGDMALFMVQNDLGPEDVLARASELAFPESFVQLLSGKMGQPDIPFPEALVSAVLGDEKPLVGRPGASLTPFDFAAAEAELKKKLNRKAISPEDLIAYALYPRVFLEFARFVEEYGDLSVLDTHTFFYGLEKDEEISVTIDAGKTLIIKFLAVGERQADGTRVVFFELNGRGRKIQVTDKHAGGDRQANAKADPDREGHVGAPMSGKLAEVYVAVGETVTGGQKVAATESMKMLNVIHAPIAGTIQGLALEPGTEVQPGDLVLTIEA